MAMFPTSVSSGPPANSTQGIFNNPVNTPLMEVLMAQSIAPGSPASYELCKLIYVYHPLGGKIVDSPIQFAQSQRREISVPKGPEERCVEAFWREWESLDADNVLANFYRQVRIYGISTLAVSAKGVSKNQAIPDAKLADGPIWFNVYDPLNTAGSLVLDQNPDSPDYQKVTSVRVQNSIIHRSRVVVAMNEDPIYIEYSPSAFGFTGRSVYQRALYPLQSYIQTLITDNMVARKVGLLVYKAKPAGSVVNGIMAAIGRVKRQLINWGGTDQTLTIDVEEDIETLNLQNLDGAGKFARDNVLSNISTAVPMPASWLNNETLAKGFGEGSEDAKKEARYIDRMRMQMRDGYAFMDEIVMRRAWSKAFYETVQKDFPEEWGGVPYAQAFYQWRNSFVATWPNYLSEPDSEKSKTEKVTFEAIVALFTALAPMCDPENKARLVMWLQDNINSKKLLFPAALSLDPDALAEYVPPQPDMAPAGEE